MSAHSSLRARRAAPALAALVAVALTTPPAAAQGTPPYTNCATVVGNLVQNCGFEGPTTVIPAGNTVPAGYTLTFNNGGRTSGLTATNPHIGGAAFNFTDFSPSSATLSQALSTVAGATYQVSFYAYPLIPGASNNAFLAAFGNTTLVNGPLTTGSYQFFSYTAHATGAATALAFTGSTSGALAIFLDDLSVTLVSGPTTTTPEPASLALLGAGLLGMGAAARRRRSTT